MADQAPQRPAGAPPGSLAPPDARSGSPAPPAARSGSPAPPGARSCEILGSSESGTYRLFRALDDSGPLPDPGQFYMLAAEERWGGPGGRPYLPRAFSFAKARRVRGGVELSFLAEAVGPGTRRLISLAGGEALRITGPLGNGFSAPRALNEAAAGAILVGGGIGVAPLAALRARLRGEGVALAALLGFRGAERHGGLELFSGAGTPCPGVRIATEDGSRGHRGYVTELLGMLLEGDDPGSAVVYACGPPAMLESVREQCETRGVVAELALEAPMACGFGACMGCAVPLRAGGYMRLCVDGPVVPAEAIETALIPGSGH